MTLDMRHTSAAHQFVPRGLPLPEAVTKRLDCHIQPDLVAIFEAVRHGLCRRVDANADPVDFVFLDPERERRAGKANDPEWRIFDLGQPGFLGDRQPNLEGGLSRQMVIL